MKVETIRTSWRSTLPMWAVCELDYLHERNGLNNDWRKRYRGVVGATMHDSTDTPFSMEIDLGRMVSLFISKLDFNERTSR